MPQVWFITGASSGLGHALALAALAAGHTVLGTARNAPSTLATPLGKAFTAAGGILVELDVTAHDASETVRAALEQHGGGRVDVLVNNAGVLVAGALEDLAVGEVARVMDTNVHGALRCTQAVLPLMRAQGAGTVVNNGSIFGTLGTAGLGAYSVSKFALEGFSEVLARETAAFGVRVVHLTPGFFRTGIEGRTPLCEKGISEAYVEGEVGRNFAVFLGVADEPGMVAGDPKRFAEAVLRVVGGEGTGLVRVPMGRDGVEYMGLKSKSLESAVGRWRDVAEGVEVDGFEEEMRLTRYFGKDD